MSFAVYLLYSFLIISVLLLFVFLFSYSFMEDNIYKGTPFECGFQSFSTNFFPFSFPFFMITLLFLLFDVEILLVCLYPLYYFLSFDIFIIFYYIMMIILLTTLYEWKSGVLVWV